MPRPGSMPMWNSGSAAVEFAITLPVLFLLLSGVVDLGRALHQHHTLAKGVRDATRYLARVPNPNAAGAQALARTMVQRASADTASPYAISEPGRGALVDVQFAITAVDNTAGIWNGPNSIPVVRTTATYAFQPLMGLIPATGLTLRLSHVERHIDE